MNLLDRKERDIAPGLVGAYRRRPGGPITPIAPSELDAALAAGDGWVWLHVDLIDRRMQGWLAGRCSLPAVVRAVFGGNAESLVRRYEALETEVNLLSKRIESGTVSPEEARKAVNALSTSIAEANAPPLTALTTSTSAPSAASAAMSAACRSASRAA